MGETNIPASTELQALERFIVDNDDLLALEERIGRFNIFDALGVARAEIRHSNFLAWLLDPAESHGQGSLFLKAVLMDLLKQAPVEMRPLSPVELDGEELRGVEIRREWKNIDLLIVCDQPRFVVAIENKIDAGLYNDWDDYETRVNDAFPDIAKMFVLLTADGEEAESAGWAAYSYADIHRVLSRCRTAYASSIGNDVAAFLDHYLRLIGSRFMDDPKIDELCHRIYQNHRQAIDLIVERAGSRSVGLINTLEALIRSEQRRWSIARVVKNQIIFCPTKWLDLLPAIGTYYPEPRVWLMLNLWVGEKSCWLGVYACPTSNPDLRRRIVEKLTEKNNPWGLSLGRKMTDQWSQLLSRDYYEWDASDPSEPDTSKIVSSTTKLLDEMEKRFEGLPGALQPILAKWDKARGSRT